VQIPSKITLVESSFWLDGGSVTLHALTEAGEPCRVHLSQRCFPDSGAGRLFFNEELVDVRSDNESRIIALLREASIQLKREQPAPSNELPISKNAMILSDDIKEVLESTPEQNLRRFRDDIVRFVESDAYVDIAKNGLPKLK
jgi:hypothetical protein